MFSDYWFGQGGPCDRFEDGEWNAAFGPTTTSYWCQPNGRTASQTYFIHSPDSFSMNQGVLPNAPYTHDPVGNGIALHYWRGGHWFSMATRPNNVTTDPSSGETSLAWTYGAFQGCVGLRG